MDSITTFAKVNKIGSQQDFMEKEALLKIIIQDIKELDTLMNTFIGKSQIPKTFINLSKSKVRGILDELDMLDSLSEMAQSESTLLKKEEIHKPVTISDPIVAPVFESTPSPTPKEPAKQDKSEPVAEFPESNKVKTAEKKVDKTVDSTIHETPVVKTNEKKNDSQPSTLGEKLGRNTSQFYDIIAKNNETETTSRYQTKAIEDLKKEIGINDRFYFQRELFNSNPELMNQTLEQLNHLNNFESAETFLTTNFTWENNNEAAKAFRELVRRRYI